MLHSENEEKKESDFALITHKIQQGICVLKTTVKEKPAHLNVVFVKYLLQNIDFDKISHIIDTLPRFV